MYKYKKRCLLELTRLILWHEFPVEILIPFLNS